MYINLFNKLSTSTPKETKPYININNVFVLLLGIFIFWVITLKATSLMIFITTLKSDSYIQIISNGDINLIVRTV